MSVMTKEQVKEVLDRVLTWPPQRQEAAAHVLREMEEQHANRARLTDEQVAGDRNSARRLRGAGESAMRPMRS